MATVSIIMTAFNQAQYIGDAIDSVLKQDFSDWELIIIDDASTDDTLKIAKQYVKLDKRICIIALKENTGSPIVPRNTGVAHATGKYILPLDADDKLMPTCVSKMVAAMEMGLADVIYSDVEYFGARSGLLQVDLPTPRTMTDHNCVVNTAMYKKSDFDKYNGYDINMRGGLEDWEFWLNFIQDGKNFYRIPETLFMYRITDNSRNVCNADDKQMHELKSYIYKKHAPLFVKRKISLFGKLHLLFVHVLRSRNSYQKLKSWYLHPSYQAIKNPKLIMTLLVKNEADIIRQNLEFHHAMGVDGFIVTDNISTDGTREILQEYKDRGWILEIIDEPSQDYSQANWVHRMATLARNKYTADWIINADADEFWRAKSGNLKNELCESYANMLFIPIYNMLDTGGDWRDNITMIDKHLSDTEISELQAAGKLSRFNQFTRQIPKVAIRASEYVHIHMGNHNADTVYWYPRTMANDIVIYHFSSRGRQRFRDKMITGGAAFERNTKLGRDVGAHWRYFYNGFRDGTLNIDTEYDKSIGTLLNPNIISKISHTDTFIRDFCNLMDIKAKFPKIMDFVDMLQMIKSGASLARFGDAEFDIAMQRNKEDPYQRPSDELSRRLLEILKRPSDKNLIVCIPPFNALHNNIANFRDGLSFWQWYWRERWDTLSPLFTNHEYGNSFFSRDAVFYELGIDDLTSIWRNRNVCFVVPENGRFENDERIFGNIKSKTEIHVPATSAFDDYDRILSECMQQPADTLFFIAAGPTATVLAYDLSNAGYQALDMGHFTNCYRQYLGEAKQPEAYPMKKEKK